MPNIMIQGTASSAGKSIMCTALCKIFREDGYKVAPFKSQNLSSKFYETKEGYKMSTAQALQAKACGLEPSPNFNPILLLFNSEGQTDVIIKGKFYKKMGALEYSDYKSFLKTMITETYKELEKEYEILVLEGAGSPAEINLNKNDIVNMGMARIADAPVLLVADIDRGGVFASLYGTVMLLDEEDRNRIKGLIINKYRGDKVFLQPGIEKIEKLLNIPVVGVIPFVHLELADEDSLIDYDKRCNYTYQKEEELEKELNKLSKIVRENMDMDYVYSLLKLK
jgi:adenosylcobyric acid synthase